MQRLPAGCSSRARPAGTAGSWRDVLTRSVLLSQRVSWLQGTLSFVLTLKCICLVGVQTPVASCSFLTRRSFAGVFAAGVRLLPEPGSGSLLDK